MLPHLFNYTLLLGVLFFMRYVIFCFFSILLLLSIIIFYLFTYTVLPSLFYPDILFYDVFVFMIFIPLEFTVAVILDNGVVFVAVLLKFIVFVDMTVVFISANVCSGPYKGTT